MSEESINASNDLVRWLKMLALPRWARFVLAVIMLLILCSALGLLVWAVLNAKLELISSAVAILTVGLPVGLIVIALVFGDGGAGKLKELTQLVLLKEVPDAIIQNLLSSSGDVHYKAPKIVPVLSGCVADYTFSANGDEDHANALGKPISLEFKLELNVRKANLVVWIPVLEDQSPLTLTQRLEQYQHCFFGATQEGYLQNKEPIHGVKSGHIGVVFIKTLGNDFLLNPGERLYFAQDLAFFVRGLLNVELQNA